MTVMPITPAPIRSSAAATAVRQPECVIRIEGLTKRYGRQMVLENLCMKVHRGEIIGVVGASGTGKSVLLRCIIGLEAIEAGSIELFGRDVATLNAAERFDRDMRWGVLFQDGALFGALTVLQNIQVPMREHLQLSEALMTELAYLKLAMVGLPADAAHKRPAELSGGMRKRAGLARALALDPEIVFLDEPTSGLDPIAAAAFDQLIRRLQATLGLTVYMVTHDLDSIHAICDRVAVLADRRIVRTDSLDALTSEPGHAWIARYFNGARAKRMRIGQDGDDGDPR